MEKDIDLWVIKILPLLNSDAKNIDEIIEELQTTKVSERSGRAMDHEQEDVFEKLRSKGYM